MADGKPAPLIVYSRPGCHLCERLVEALLPLIRGRADLEIVDIDADEALRASYGERIPVLEYRGAFVCQYVLDEAAVREVLDTMAAS